MRDMLRFTTFLAPEMYEVYEAMVAYVGESLGRPASLHVGHDLEEFAHADADFGFV